ncbi:MAG: NapC/NirT family cytochrome c, partial [Chloroflexota bacterium]
LLLSGFAMFAVFGSLQTLHWTETADFCGRCHTMAPELAAYRAGPHSDVSCAECHVEPGVAGWVKAKINGSKQLAEVLLGTFPTPIPPPEHSNLPSAEDTCLRCHSLDRLTTTKLVSRTQFTEDEDNTRQFVALMVRPKSGDALDVDRGVHWHVLRDVQYIASDAAAQRIDWVGVKQPDGTFREFIAQNRIVVAEDVGPELEGIKAEEPAQRMDCMSCHNRVGHPILNPRAGIDQRLLDGQIDEDLPFIKREAMRILWAGYPSAAMARSEADRLRDFYRLEYPEVAETQAAAIDEAIDQIGELYEFTATPEMRVTASTYPDNLGHIDFAGCFRCHDGGHFLVSEGAVTEETIPSTCDTCHSYPQLGKTVASLPMGKPPETHEDRLFIFSHKDLAVDVDPGGQSCGDCHARDYCVNCHSTGAAEVDHDEMLTSHSKTIQTTGVTSCSYCHQRVYCARCHGPSEDVMPRGSIAGVLGADAPRGVRWPLRPSGPDP